MYIYYFYSFNLTYITYKYVKYAVDQIYLLRMCYWCSVLFRALYCFQSGSSMPCQNIKYILKCWQDIWDHQIYNKLYERYSLVGKTPCSYDQNRKEQVVLTRCRIGYSRLTHSYLLNNEERPECIPCNSSYSLKHDLLDSVDVTDIRQTFCNVNNLYDLFTNVVGDTILN